MASRTRYDAWFYDRLIAIEDRHFWFRARNRLLDRVLRREAPRRPRLRILEVGCGTGNVLRVLERGCPHALLVGMDSLREGLLHGRRRTGGRLLQGDARHAPFRVGFDVIGLFDVLEHLPDDRRVLRDLHRLLAPGGRLLLTVPASPRLWSYFDELNQHCRRYDPGDLRTKLTEAGFHVVWCTPFMMTLFPIIRVARWFATRRPAGVGTTPQDLAEAEFRVRRGINELLLALLSMEVRWVSTRRKLLFGTSLLAVAAKPDCPPEA